LSFGLDEVHRGAGWFKEMKAIITFLLITISVGSIAQNYTSAANGQWTTASNWNNTSGWGSAIPAVDGSGNGTITMNKNMTINSAYSTGSVTLIIGSGNSLSVSSDMTVDGGSTVNVSGNLVVNGDLTLNSTLNILPGGSVTVYGSVIVRNSDNLVVGTNVASPYADLVIKNDLKQKNSGDVVLNKDARVIVLGNVSDNNNGGTKLTLNQGAQMYVNGNINYSGGGDDIDNYNTTNPYGLYVNGTINNSGGGASTTANTANKATMILTDPTFATWVGVQTTVMPVTLVSFEVAHVSEEGIELKWETASEKNFDYFVVEGSTDGREFYELTKTREYNYIVVNPAVGKSYYRLKSVDLDGYTETFKMVTATYESSKAVKVFPNPVVDSKVNIDFNFDPSEDVMVTITNMNGMEVSRQVLNAMQNQLVLSVEPGTYVMKIQSAEISSVSRVVIK
jgi:hypothetical protein